jgi:hypothetical protein
MRWMLYAPPGLERPALALPLFHLWFLYLLTLLYAMLLAVCLGIVERFDDRPS